MVVNFTRSTIEKFLISVTDAQGKMAETLLARSPGQGAVTRYNQITPAECLKSNMKLYNFPFFFAFFFDNFKIEILSVKLK